MDAEKRILPIGTKNGCLTIIAGFEAYQSERAIEKIAKLEEEKQKFIAGEKSSWCNFESVETFNQQIQHEKEAKLYKVQCKCGRTFFRDEDFIFRKRWRCCSNDCELRIKKYPRIETSNYNISFVKNIYDSLEIRECINDSLEVIDHKDKAIYLYKVFRCKCYLCGKEHIIRSDRFGIRSDIYGRNAERGYYSDAYCECRKDSSSFQWRTEKILHEYGIPYRVEISFSDLLSEKGNPLRFDFGVLDKNDNIKYLVECQGKQHYEIGGGYGGYSSLNVRQKRDEQKRKYTHDNGIQLIEIPYTYNTYEKEEKYLKEVGII